MSLLAYASSGPVMAPISPRREMGAYESLWLDERATFKRIAEKFSKDQSALPSDFVSDADATERASQAISIIKQSGVRQFGVRVNHAGDYPVKLRDAKHPIEFLYYRGTWELVEKPSVAIVGSRKPSEEGLLRAQRLSRNLVSRGFTVVSGLATGIDSAAHMEAIEAGGDTIAVIGTSIADVYPKENSDLQNIIARDHLVISQVPILRFARQHWQGNRFFFPERNVTMSALTKATIIVEASDTSGTLIQARAALHQGRKLFILNSCFERSDISWPAKFEKRGAIRVRELDDIWGHLKDSD